MGHKMPESWFEPAYVMWVAKNQWERLEQRVHFLDAQWNEGDH